MILLALLFTACSVRAQFVYYYQTGIPNQVYTSPFQSPFIQPQFYYQSPALSLPPKAKIAQTPPPTAIPAVRQQPAAITHKIPNIYRGFGYHTSYDDGASSTVVFFSGPQPKDQRFTIASDMLDPHSTSDITKKISDAIAAPGKESSQHEFGSLTPIIRTLFRNPQPLNGLVNFYSAPGFPANTAPLAVGRSLNLTALTNQTEPNSQTSAKHDEEPAESIINALHVNSVESKEKTEANLKNVTDKVEESVTATEKAESAITTVKAEDDDDTFVINVDDEESNSVTTTEISSNETTTVDV